MKRALFLGLALFWIVTSSEAANGTAISLILRYPDAMPVGWGKPIRFVVEDNAVTAHDTLCDWFCMNPCLSFDGRKMAFFRSSMKRTASGVSGTNDPCFLSVMDLATKQIVDLVQMPQVVIAAYRLDWPKGDWLFYYKGAGEVWRIDVTQPTQNDFVCDYLKSTDGWNDFRRWSISADGRFAAVHTAASIAGLTVHKFPIDNTDPLEWWDDMYKMNAGSLPGGGCNPAISPSGKYMWHYTSAVHNEIHCELYDSSAGTISEIAVGTGSKLSLSLTKDMEQWLGYDIGYGAEYPRISANSDKWVLQNFGWTAQGELVFRNGNQVLANWVDKMVVRTTQNPKKGAADETSLAAETGDFWVDGGAAAEGRYEDIAGSWIAVDAAGVYVRAQATGVNPYEVTMTSTPTDANIYYTTDGSEPTLQSGTKYTGRFALTLTDMTMSVKLKLKGFKDGMPSGRTVTKVFFPHTLADSGGITVDCWENIAGTSVSALTTDSRFPQSPNTTMVGRSGLTLHIGNLDNWGERVHGYLVPRVTGIYYFAVKSRGEAIVYLSRTDRPIDTVKICSSTFTSHYDAEAGQKSQGIALVAGQRYYVCVLHKVSDAEILGIRWTLPDGTMQDPIPSNSLLPYGSGAVVTVPRSGAGPRKTADVRVLRLYSVNGSVVWSSTSAKPLHSVPAGLYVMSSTVNGHTRARLKAALLRSARH